MLPRVLLLTASIALATSAVRADDLQTYAQQCDAAIGVTVPDFDCDAGTEVPGQGAVFASNAVCDEPNRLNRQCDPGSRFQVLTRTTNAYVVAHCRKENGPAGNYGDIAVIQHSRKNGATCFYQALGDQSHGNLPGGSSAAGTPPGDKPVKAPAKGLVAFSWLSPAGTAHIGCGACHDNGPIIRSPYLNQVKGTNALPGSDDSGFNGPDQPYAFVGKEFATWRALSVEVGGNECVSCHRLGTSMIPLNGLVGENGTALDFAIRATAASEVAKNPPSPHSPIWMPPAPVQLAFNQTHANAAKAVHDCALHRADSPLPNSDACRITEFARDYVAPTPPQLAPNVATILEAVLIPIR